MAELLILPSLRRAIDHAERTDAEHLRERLHRPVEVTNDDADLDRRAEGPRQQIRGLGIGGMGHGTFLWASNGWAGLRSSQGFIIVRIPKSVNRRLEAAGRSMYWRMAPQELPR
jgi:hypothetical protein